MTIKRVHMLTAEEYRSLVDPAADWYWFKECGDPKYREDNALAPLPPEAPYPLGTYFAVETADQWEIRRVSKPVSNTRPLPPYLRQDRTKHFTWSEPTISVHATKEEARKELIRLVAKQ
jgi:hypothetical protein